MTRTSVAASATIGQIATAPTGRLPYLLTEAATITKPAAPATAIHHKRHADVAEFIAELDKRSEGASDAERGIYAVLKSEATRTGDVHAVANWAADLMERHFKNEPAPAVVTAPGSSDRLIEAELFTSDADVPRPVLAVFTGHEVGGSVELDVAGADELIEQFEVFVPRLRVLRDQLAAVEAGR